MPSSLPPAKDSEDVATRPSSEIETNFKIHRETAPLKIHT